MKLAQSSIHKFLFPLEDTKFPKSENLNVYNVPEIRKTPFMNQWKKEIPFNKIQDISRTIWSLNRKAPIEDEQICFSERLRSMIHKIRIQMIVFRYVL